MLFRCWDSGIWLGHQRAPFAAQSDSACASGQGNVAVCDAFRRLWCTLTHARNPDPTIAELTLAGQAYFDKTYGETAKHTQDLLDAIYPDLGAPSIVGWSTSLNF